MDEIWTAYKTNSMTRSDALAALHKLAKLTELGAADILDHEMSPGARISHGITKR